MPDPSGFIPGGQSLVLSGTSMATPHTAGAMALLKQLHPDWSVEELNALVMNGAVHDLTVGAQVSGWLARGILGADEDRELVPTIRGKVVDVQTRACHDRQIGDC